MLTEEHREEFRRAYGCETLEIYGCNEIGNMAWQCREAGSLHIESESAIVEVTDVRADTGGVRVGTVVVTNLENRVMPFLRYEVGDEMVLPESSECACGRTLPVLGRVHGRSDDVLEVDGRRFDWHFFCNNFKDMDYIERYQVVQSAAGGVSFLVHLKDQATRHAVAARRRSEALSESIFRHR